MNLKYGSSSLTAIMFDSPIVETQFDMDFVNDWVVNPNNSAGVTVEPGKITVTKVKPKEWFIRSSYGYTTSAARNEKFMGQVFRLSGLQAMWNDTTGGITSVVDNPLGNTGQSYYPVGLIISPIRTSDGLLLSHIYPWDMNIPGGYFKHVYGTSQGWSTYGYGYDEDIAMFNFACGYDNYPEVGFAFWTGVEGDPNDDGYLTLTTPFVIQMINSYAVDPTTVESYKVMLEGDVMYEKDRTFNNTLIRHNLADIESNNFTEKVQGLTIPILPNKLSQNVAYVVNNRYYTTKYGKLRFMVPTDLASLVADSEPIKYWCTDSGNEFWDAVINIFKTTAITQPNYGQCLFTKSNIKGAYDTSENNDSTVHLTFNMGQDSNYLAIDHIFDYSTVDKVDIQVNSGTLKSLVCAFRQTKSLTSVTMSHNGGDIRIAEWSGSFEGSALVNFPAHLGVMNSEWLTNPRTNTEVSDTLCDINYAFDGSVLSTIGNLKASSGTEDQMYYSMKVAPYCIEAFRGWSGTQILYILDMMYVTPLTAYTHRFLDAPNLTSVKIKNLNAGDWSFDGVVRNNTYAGNLTKLDKASVNYLLYNVFDLNENINDTSHFENEFNSFNGWTETAGVKHGIVYSAYGAGVLSKTLSVAGTMKIRVGALTGVSLTLTNGGSTRQITSLEEMDLSLSAGECSFRVTVTGSNPYCVIYLADHYRSELSNVTSANLYLPANVEYDTDALMTAIDRRWNVYLGGSQAVPTKS